MPKQHRINVKKVAKKKNGNGKGEIAPSQYMTIYSVQAEVETLSTTYAYKCYYMGQTRYRRNYLKVWRIRLER